MLWFILRLFVGVAVAVFVMALLFVAKEAEKQMDAEIEENEDYY